jgi:hypothetical protein
MGRVIVRHNEENVGTRVVAAVMIGQSKGRQEGEEREKFRGHFLVGVREHSAGATRKAY